jgi:hypothetical protein
MKMCAKCNTNPVHIKKRNLCSACYQLERKRNGGYFIDQELYDYKTPQTMKDHDENREITFIKNFFDHKEWIHQPATFRLNGTKYMPDFYDQKRNCFIEVAGSRQAFHANKDKYDEFKKYYPQINFEVRTPSGNLLEKCDGLFIWGS